MLKTLADKVRPHLLPAVLLLVITAAIYCRVLGHDFLLNWDDNEYVLDNDAVYGISISHIQRVFGSYYVGNYAPVQMLSYMLDYELWGLWPGGFLLTNILLHFLNGLMLYGLLFTIYRDRLLAATAAAIFLFHPLQVESVAWISQRKNLLAMLFFLLAWRGYIAFRDKEGRHAWYYYAGALAAFLLALLSKSVAVIFPLVILLYDRCFYPPGRRQRLADKLPFIALATLTAALALRTQSVECGCGRVPFGHYGGSVLATMLTMAPVWCRYLGMLFWPANLSAMYDPAIHKTIDMPVALALLLLAGAGYICLMLLKADRRTGFWPLLFLIGFLPVSQIVPLVTLMNDRYAYFPLLGAAVMGGIGAVKLRERLGSSRKFLGIVLIAVPLFLLATVAPADTARRAEPSPASCGTEKKLCKPGRRKSASIRSTLRWYERLRVKARFAETSDLPSPLTELVTVSTVSARSNCDSCKAAARLRNESVADSSISWFVRRRWASPCAAGASGRDCTMRVNVLPATAVRSREPCQGMSGWSHSSQARRSPSGDRRGAATKSGPLTSTSIEATPLSGTDTIEAFASPGPEWSSRTARTRSRRGSMRRSANRHGPAIVIGTGSARPGSRR